MNSIENIDVQAGYAQDGFLNAVLNRMGLKNDAALSRVLKVTPPVISKIRNGRSPIRASVLIRLHEESGISIKELRGLMGDRRDKFRFGGAGFSLDDNRLN